MKNFRLWRNYSDNEVTKLELIRSLWKRFYGDEDMVESSYPMQLQWNPDVKDKPLCCPVATDLKPSATKLGDGHFQEEARQILGHICNYQEVKVQRGSYYNDPWNLYLEEFKVFVINLSRQDPGDPGAHLFVRKRKRYVRESWMHVFPPSYEDNMRQTLIEIEKILERTEKDAYKEAHNTSARTQFELFGKTLRKIIKEELDILVYGLRDDEQLPLTFIVEDMRANRRNIGNCRVGNLLRKALDLPVFLQIYPSSRPQYNKTLALKDVYMDKNPFFPESGALVLPKDYQIDPDRPATIANFFEEKAIYEPFRKNAYLAENYISILGYTIELAKLVVFARNIQDLARLGGDILTYGIARQQLLDLMTVYTAIANKVRTISNSVLETLADAAYKLAMQGNSSASSVWFQNYLKLSSTADNVHDLFVEADQHCVQIQTIINNVSLQQWLQIARTETQLFASTVQSFAEHIHHIGLRDKPKPLNDKQMIHLIEDKERETIESPSPAINNKLPIIPEEVEKNKLLTNEDGPNIAIQPKIELSPRSNGSTEAPRPNTAAPVRKKSFLEHFSFSRSSRSSSTPRGDAGSVSMPAISTSSILKEYREREKEKEKEKKEIERKKRAAAPTKSTSGSSSLLLKEMNAIAPNDQLDFGGGYGFM